MGFARHPTGACSDSLGVDITDPGFWELGLRLLDEMVSEAETLAG